MMSAHAYSCPRVPAIWRAGAGHRPDPTAAQRSTLIFLTACIADGIVLLAWDSTNGGLPVQYVIGAFTWLILFVSLRCATPDIRRQAVAMVIVATLLECLASRVVGLYCYRYHNLPLYVPPGHGLFYLAAIRLCTLPHVQRWRRRIVVGVALVSTGWMVHGLLAGPWGDTEGALWWLVLAFFLVRGRDPLLFAVTYILTMSLEFYGTGLGAWHWTPVLPLTHLTAANPPSACAAGYCVLDALACCFASRLAPLATYWERAWTRYRRGGEGDAMMGPLNNGTVPGRGFPTGHINGTPRAVPFTFQWVMNW
jgi:hypothetical protein